MNPFDRKPVVQRQSKDVVLSASVVKPMIPVVVVPMVPVLVVGVPGVPVVVVPAVVVPVSLEVVSSLVLVDLFVPVVQLFQSLLWKHWKKMCFQWFR